MPRSLLDILGLCNTDTLVVSAKKPYTWANGDCDVEKTVANAPIIALVYIHEDAPQPDDNSDDLALIKAAAEAESADETATNNYNAALVHHHIHTHWKQYSNWYLVLVACEQVRPLEAANIVNFCKMCKAPSMPAKVSLFIKYFATMQPHLVGIPAILDRFIGNKFFEYHTTGSSTPRLCVEALDDAAGLKIFTGAEKAAIRKAASSIDQVDVARLIDNVTLVKVSAIHKASGTHPESWPMGDKAVARFSGSKFRALVKFLVAIYNKQTNTDDLDSKDHATLVANMHMLIGGFASANRIGVTLSGANRRARVGDGDDDGDDDDDSAASDGGPPGDDGLFPPVDEDVFENAGRAGGGIGDGPMTADV
jgi:hypothetical protein